MGLMDLVDNITKKDAEKIRSSERGLIVYSEFTNTSSQHMPLYTFVEKSGIALALALRLHYRKFTVLSGMNGDSEDFIAALKAMGKEKKIEAIDVMMHMHGNPNKMYFNDTTDSDKLQTSVEKLKLKGKLRMFYTTACYGSTHAQDMVQAGFKCGAGAVKVNANSATEYPEFLTRWVGHESFKNCIEKSYNASMTKVFEDRAKKMGFSDVDSTKKIWGNGKINIITPV